MKPWRSTLFAFAASVLIVCIFTQTVFAATFSFSVSGSDRLSIDYEGSGTITHMNAGPPTRFKSSPTSLLDLNIMRASDLRVSTTGAAFGNIDIGTRAPIVHTVVSYLIPFSGFTAPPFVKVGETPFGGATFALDAAGAAVLQAQIDQFGPDKLFLSLFLSSGFLSSGGVTIFSAVREISVDVKPGNDDNSINPNSRGKITVAILTTATFDANSVNVDSLRFGATGSEASAEHSAFDDVDGDGDLDLVLHFRTQETNIKCETAIAFLRGTSLTGELIGGWNTISTVGCK